MKQGLEEAGSQVYMSVSYAYTYKNDAGKNSFCTLMECAFC